jgi:hypothetical protein
MDAKNNAIGKPSNEDNKMKQEPLDRLTSLALECEEDWKQIILHLSLLHRRIGRLEGRIEVLSSQLRDEISHSRGFELISFSQALGLIGDIHFQLQDLGITNLAPVIKDNVSSHDLEIKTNTSVTKSEEE